MLFLVDQDLFYPAGSGKMIYICNGQLGYQWVNQCQFSHLPYLISFFDSSMAWVTFLGMYHKLFFTLMSAQTACTDDPAFLNDSL